MEAGRGSLIEEADRLRDARDWRGAADAYAAWLRQSPQDWPAWVQHGHAVKELGDPEGALASYRQAEHGLPRDADLQVQIGHALKRAGDATGARRAYGRALALDPGSDAAWREVAPLLGDSLVAAAPEAEGLSLLGDPAVVFDLTDLLSWFGAHRAPSGIQRVQLELVGPALRAGAAAVSVTLAVFHPASAGWRALPKEVFLRLAALSRSGADPFDAAWEDTVATAQRALDAAPEFAFPEGAWLVNLGSSWTLPDYHLALRAAKARAHIRYAPLLHDCGPLVVPEHSPPDTASAFARWFSLLAPHADLVLSVSAATQAEAEALRATHLPGQPSPPGAVLGLDAAPVRPAAMAREHPGVAALAGQPYVLFLATIESRKNHLFVLNAWLALTRKLGAARMPLLVLAGRPGFGGDPALALLRNAPALRDGALHLDDVPDAALPALHRGALFCLYNSDHEGWGLPVTEALSHGKAVLCPDHTGLREAGAGLALHFRGGSEPDFLEKLERLVTDAAFRDAIATKVASGLALRSWQAISDQLLTVLAQQPDHRAMAPTPPSLPLGAIQPLAAMAARLPGPALAVAEMIRAGAGWHAPEAWGCWTRPGRALLRMTPAAALGRRLRLHLLLRAPATPQRLRITLRGTAPLSLALTPGSETVAALEVTLDQPVMELSIEAEPATVGAAPDGPAPDGADEARQVGVGVVSIMVCAEEDVLARLDYLERQRFTWPEAEG